MSLTHYMRTSIGIIILWYRIHFDKLDYDL